MSKMYDALADWWPLLSAPEDYAEEAGFYRTELCNAFGGEPRTLLELGSGGGNNASHLKHHFDLTLVDRAPGMLEVSRGLNPECEHLEGDMRTARLGRTFDTVFIHDAIMYMTTVADLQRAIDTAFVHCAPGGAALFAPDYVRETFRTVTGHGGHDGPERSLRYLDWSWDPDPSDTSFVVDYAFLLREGDQKPVLEYDRHVEGIFSREVWLDVIRGAGFTPRSVTFQHTGQDEPVEGFVATKPQP